MTAKAKTEATPKQDKRTLTYKGCKEFKGRVEHTQQQMDQLKAAIDKGMTYAEINRKDGPITAGDGHKFVAYAVRRKWVRFS